MECHGRSPGFTVFAKVGSSPDGVRLAAPKNGIDG
jgi:hypothetical protein